MTDMMMMMMMNMDCGQAETWRALDNKHYPVQL